MDIFLRLRPSYVFRTNQKTIFSILLQEPAHIPWGSLLVCLRLASSHKSNLSRINTIGSFLPFPIPMDRSTAKRKKKYKDFISSLGQEGNILCQINRI